MKPNLMTALLPMLAAAFFVSCRSEEAVSVDGPGRDLVASARNYFEAVASSVTPDTDIHSLRLSPGEFAPQWSRATVSDAGDFSSVDVPITADFLYRASLSGSDGASKTLVNIFQKLVVSKDNRSGKMSAYILTLIPDANHPRGGRDVCYRFATGGDKDGYSGLALLTPLGRNTPERITRYRDGETVCEETCFDPHPDLAAIKRLGSMLPDMELLRMITQTRNGQECVLCHNATPTGEGVCPTCKINNCPICMCPDHGSHDYLDEEGVCQACGMLNCLVCRYCCKPYCVCEGSCMSVSRCDVCGSPSCGPCSECDQPQCLCRCSVGTKPPVERPDWNGGHWGGSSSQNPPSSTVDYSVPDELVERVFIMPEGLVGGARDEIIDVIGCWTIPALLETVVDCFPGDGPYIKVELAPNLNDAAHYNIDENILYLRSPGVFNTVKNGRKLCEELFKIGQVFYLPRNTDCVTKEMFKFGVDGYANLAFEMKFFTDLFVGYKYKQHLGCDTFDKYIFVYTDYELFLRDLTGNFKSLSYRGGVYNPGPDEYGAIRLFRDQFTYNEIWCSYDVKFTPDDNPIVLVSAIL